MNNEQQNFVSRVQAFAQLISAQYGEICALNALWYGQTAHYQNVIDDAALQSVSSLAHLTQAELNELVYIVGQLKTLMDGRLEQIAVVSA